MWLGEPPRLRSGSGEPGLARGPARGLARLRGRRAHPDGVPSGASAGRVRVG